MSNKKIYLYGDNIGAVEYVQHMGNDLTVVNAARVSFGVHKQEIDDKDKKLIKYLIDHRHTSTLEHNVITFKFTVPLFVRSQHHRHRTWSFNEISRRYTAEDIKFYEPSIFRTQNRNNRQASNIDQLINPILIENEQDNAKFIKEMDITAAQAVKDHHRDSVRLYNILMESGVCREQARGILPQNLYTSYIGTVDLNNLMKFIDLRTHEGAQWEIQQVANACLQMTQQIWPQVISSYNSNKL